MRSLSPASEVILRHQDHFSGKNVLILGDIQDDISTKLGTNNVRVVTNEYHHWLKLLNRITDRAHFSATVDPQIAQRCDTVIYYWPKNKLQADFQLRSLCSNLPIGSALFIVGENRSGVKSADKALEGSSKLKKIDSARRCSLFYGELEKQTIFDVNNWWKTYSYNGTRIMALPGVFSQNELDQGSQLLLSTFTTPIKGRLLDLACGAGVIATVLGKQNPGLSLTLSDANAQALTSSNATLKLNNLSAGSVLASDVYSNIEGPFDWIVSNPPFHDGINTEYSTAERMIIQAPNYLAPGGRFRIVANAFLPYATTLDYVFGQHTVLAKTGKFKVYEAIKKYND